jgi:hypothetical protein
MRKVIVSEFLLLDESCKPWEAERRTGETDSSTAAGRCTGCGWSMGALHQRWHRHG